MPRLADHEARVRALCLREEPGPGELSPLGDDGWRWLRYREMVRRRLLDVLEHAFPRFRAALGEAPFVSLFDGFLGAGGPASPFFRDVPGELLGWLESARGDVPEGAMDLARYEWALQATSYAEDGTTLPSAGELDMARPVALLRAHRLLALAHAVHRDGVVPPFPETSTHLCVYRDPETHEVRTLELSPAAFALIDELAAARPLTVAIEAAARRAGAPLDRGFLEATSAVLSDLVARGLIGGAGRARVPRSPAMGPG
jgi:hypothetical protein